MPTIVMGDFNDWFWVGSVRKALSRELPGRTRFRTFPSIFPLLRLDRIYCRPHGAFVDCYTDRGARGGLGSSAGDRGRACSYKKKGGRSRLSLTQ